MEIFEAMPKNWGNSIGITIPKEIVQKEHITTKKKIQLIFVGSGMDRLRKAAGTLKLKIPTQQAMDEIDEGYD
jgi:antitoxin component of MazEF toxin-antitoxin module